MSAPIHVERARERSRTLWRRLEPARRHVRRRFTVDTRALAVFRIGLALAILLDLAHRSLYLEYFYTDAGVYPLYAYEQTYTAYNGYSLHALSGDLWFQAALFVLAGLVAVAMLVGYRTRLATLVSLLLLFSLHARNPGVLNGGDRLFRVLLIVAVLPPLGERWSVDALRRGEPREAVASLPVAALLLQPVAVFVTNVAEKYTGDTWFHGEALQVALSNDMMTILLGNHVTAYPTLLELLTYGWVFLLAGSPLFLLATTGRLRAAAVFAYFGAFVGMALTMTVGLFPLLLATSLVPFLTAPFWDALARRVPGRLHEFRESLAENRVVAAARSRLARPPVERRLLGLLRERGHDSAASFAVTYAGSLLTVLGALLVVWIVLFSATEVTVLDPPERIDHTHLDQQSWGLYAPNPSTSYSWYVVEAHGAGGESVDALDGGEVSFDRPPDVAATYETFRHRKFMQRVRDSGQRNYDTSIAASYADWACRQADQREGGFVEQVTVHRMIQPSPVDGEWEEPDRVTVIEWECGTPIEEA